MTTLASMTLMSEIRLPFVNQSLPPHENHKEEEWPAVTNRNAPIPSGVPPVFPMDVLKGPAESMMFGGVRVEERA